MLSILYKGDAAFHELYCDIIVSNVLKIHPKKVKMKKKIQKKFQNGEKYKDMYVMNARYFMVLAASKKTGHFFIFITS